MPYNPDNKLKREDATEVLKGGPPMGRASNKNRYEMKPAGDIQGMVRLKKRCIDGTIGSVTDEMIVEDCEYMTPQDRHIAEMYMSGNEEALEYFD